VEPYLIENLNDSSPLSVDQPFS